MSAFFNAIFGKLTEQPHQDMPPSSQQPAAGDNPIYDSWSDTASSCDDLDLDDAIDTDEAENADCALDMPVLFGKDLPPCGLEIQIAYENVNKRLRKQWIADFGASSALSVCHVVNKALEDDKKNRPPFSPTTPTMRVLGQFRLPWRRESVFLYELRWIKYFIREAEEAKEAHAKTMTESGPPRELHLRCDREDVLQLWDAWHAKKRGTPLILQKSVGATLARESSGARTTVDVGTQVDGVEMEDPVVV